MTNERLIPYWVKHSWMIFSNFVGLGHWYIFKSWTKCYTLCEYLFLWTVVFLSFIKVNYFQTVSFLKLTKSPRSVYPFIRKIIYFYTKIDNIRFLMQVFEASITLHECKKAILRFKGKYSPVFECFFVFIELNKIKFKVSFISIFSFF